ncbi:tRNA lysidine(34) synthetase TilS [Polaribacter sp.]|nr:tRNA lysidine(34) synthetase TilS [Polaribacter sp.]
MLQKLSHILQQNFPFLKDKKLLIAISGGIDSVVLTHLLSVLNFNISLAHCNFNLRNTASDLDTVFVKELAEKLQIKCFTTSFQTAKIAKENKESTQITARNLRYTWFQETLQAHHFDFVLTAHHADDNLETFLINLTRGSGLDGFTGIPEVNGNIIRPLLKFSRNEIESFAKENGILWREDQSNASTKYVRNKIRHKILPVLKEINPSLLETFSKTIEHLKESAQIIDDSIEKISKNVVLKENGIAKFKVDKLQQLSNPKAYLYQLLKTYNFSEFNDIYNLLSAQSGKQVFSKTHVLLKDRDVLILSKRENLSEDQKAQEVTFSISKNTAKITTPVHLTLEEVTEQSIQNKNTIYVSKESLKHPLIIRKWENGDYFYPAGMQGKKKLSKYFKDEKLSLLEKQNTWLLCSADDSIIWIIGMRKDNRFKIETKTSKTYLKITFLQ